MHKFSEAEIITELKKLHTVAPRAQFVQRLNTALIPSLGKQTKPSWLGALRIALTALVILLTSGGGIVLASQNSRPGDLLYPLKQTTQKLYTVIAPHTAKTEPNTTEPQQPQQTAEVPAAQPSASPTLVPAVAAPPTSTVSLASPLPSVTPTVQAAVSVSPSPEAAGVTITTPIISTDITLPLLNGESAVSSPVPTPSNEPIIKLPIKIEIGL